MKKSLIIGVTALTIGTAGAEIKPLSEGIELTLEQKKARIQEICNNPVYTKHMINPKDICDISIDNGLTWTSLERFLAAGGLLTGVGAVAYIIRRRKKNLESNQHDLGNGGENTNGEGMEVSDEIIAVSTDEISDLSTDQNIEVGVSGEVEGLSHVDIDLSQDLKKDTIPHGIDFDLSEPEIGENKSVVEVANGTGKRFHSVKSDVINDDILRFVASQSKTGLSLGILQGKFGLLSRDAETIIRALQEAGIIGEKKQNYYKIL